MEEVMIGKEVLHNKYGTGRITGLKNFYITVQFGNAELKKFRYPDAFEGFLITNDKELQEQVQIDLLDRRNDPDYSEHKKMDAFYRSKREFEEKKAAEQEEKRQQQIEKQRRAQMLSRQRMHIEIVKGRF